MNIWIFVKHNHGSGGHFQILPYILKNSFPLEGLVIAAAKRSGFRVALCRWHEWSLRLALRGLIDWRSQHVVSCAETCKSGAKVATEVSVANVAKEKKLFLDEVHPAWNFTWNGTNKKSSPLVWKGKKDSTLPNLHDFGVQHVKFPGCTPRKTNMEPSNHPLRKENDLPNLHDYVPC